MAQSFLSNLRTYTRRYLQLLLGRTTAVGSRFGNNPEVALVAPDSHSKTMDHGTLTSEFDLDPVDIGQGTQKVRPVTCCVECRKRKVKCDRLKPCGPCVAGSRSCVFVRTKRGTRSRIRSQQPATSTENHHSSRTTFGTSTLPDNPHFSAPSQFVTSIVEHKGGSATQTGTGDHSFYDGTYNHDSDEVEVEWTLRLGKLTISERIGGIFRPHAVDTVSPEDKPLKQTM